MNTQFVSDSDPEGLTNITKAFAAGSIAMMLRMLENTPVDTRQTMIRLQDEKGWRMGIEITTDNFGCTEISVVGVSLDGDRKAFSTVALGAKKNAH